MSSFLYNDVACRNLNVNTVANISGTWNQTGSVSLSNGLGAANNFVKRNAGPTLSYVAFALSDIPAGAANQTLRTVAGVPGWASVATSYYRYTMNMTSQDYNSGATTALTFNSVSNNISTNGTPLLSQFANVGAGPFTGFTVGSTGIYRVNYTIALNCTSTGVNQIGVRLLINGTPVGPLIYSSILPVGISGVVTVSGSSTVSLTAANSVSFRAERVQGTDAITSIAADSIIDVSLLSIVN